MELISMTKFVLSKKRSEETNDIVLRQIINYAKFLSQPLALGMFVPCDEKGNMLDWTCPVEELGCTNECKTKTKAFEEAKERVLFEGVECNTYNENGSFTLYIGNCQIAYYKAVPDYITWHYESMEDLVNLGIKLTPNAIKKIGL